MMLFQKSYRCLSQINFLSVKRINITSTPKATTVPLLLGCIWKAKKENAKYKVKSTVNHNNNHPWRYRVAFTSGANTRGVPSAVLCLAWSIRSLQHPMQRNQIIFFFCRKSTLISQLSSKYGILGAFFKVTRRQCTNSVYILFLINLQPKRGLI